MTLSAMEQLSDKNAYLILDSCLASQQFEIYMNNVGTVTLLERGQPIRKMSNK